MSQVKETKKKTYVQQFVEDVQRQIDEEGLRGISASNFYDGDSIVGVLKAKQYSARLNSGGMIGYSLEDAIKGKKPKKGKHVSIARIAKEMLKMFSAPVICSTTFYPDGREPTHTGGGVQLDWPQEEVSFKFNDSQKR